MDRARPGRRRSSTEIVTERKKKKSSADLQEITKLLTVQSEDALAQSPLSKLRGSECWKLPKGWTRSLRNKVICLDHKNKKVVHGHPVTSKASPERHLRVMLTNVLWTDLGRKFRKTLPRNDANLCDTSKVQSDSLPSTSVDSIETCQKLDPHHQSLNLSERMNFRLCNFDDNQEKRLQASNKEIGELFWDTQSYIDGYPANGVRKKILKDLTYN